MPTQLQRICSAIDDIPSDLDFDVSQSELQFPTESELQLSQGLNNYLSQRLDTDSASALGEDEGLVGSQDGMPDTSFTQGPGPRVQKARTAGRAE